SVRFIPLGILPVGTPLRMRVGAGLQDLTGESSPFQGAPAATVNTTFNATGSSASLDAFRETFGVGGDAPNSWEDTQAIFSVARASWGAGQLSAAWGTNGQSRARSKWIPLGLGRIQSGGASTTPSFHFPGVGADGVLPVAGGFIDRIGATSAPIPLLSLGAQAITVPLAELNTLGEPYMAQPALLRGCRVELSPPGGAGTGALATVKEARMQGSDVLIQFNTGCEYGLADCVPMDLTLTYTGHAGVTATIQEQAFEAATRFTSDMVPADARITILFDATRADATGEPDPAAAYSQSSGWTTDITALSGTAWDFVRFEVFFEMDVSGDGWGPFDPLPHLRWIGFQFDERP
ncbi:MAG: hypothetical protein KDB61_11815, partial [Planctomycetes bacterium]|nr:hypothetical protein [Planctomycetota bacterium]